MSSEQEIIRSAALNPAAEPNALQAEFDQIVAQPRLLLAAAGRGPERDVAVLHRPAVEGADAGPRAERPADGREVPRQLWFRLIVGAS